MKRVELDEVPSPRNLHYVPQFYLKGFKCVPGRIYAYRFCRAIEERPIKQTASAPDFYKFMDGSGSWDNVSVENVFTNNIECPAKRVFEKIARRDPLEDRDFSIMIRFIIALQRRTPKHKEIMKPALRAEVERRMQVIESDIKAQLAAKIIASGESLLHFDGLWELQRRSVVEEIAYWRDPESAIDRLYPVVCAGESDLIPPVMRRRKWTFLYVAHGGSKFVTSDVPVWYDSVGIDRPADCLILPLTEDTALAISGKPGPSGEYVGAPIDEVERINAKTVANAWYEVYAGFRSDSLKQLVDSTLGSGHRLGPGIWPPPWVVDEIERGRRKRSERREASRTARLEAVS